jgi:hypothetical protein
MKSTNDGRAMQVRLRPLLVWLAAIAANGAVAVELATPHPGEMTRYDLPGYALLAVGNAQLRRDMAKLPQLKRALELSTGIDVKPTGIPTFVYVVSTSIWDRYLESGTGTPSDFVPTRFANYVIANNSAVDRFRLFHEHAHLYLYNQMPGVYPLWFDEGLAVMMTRAEYSGQSARFSPARHDDRGGWVPTGRVLRATRSSPEYLNQKELLSFHFQSQAMVYRGFVDEPEFGKRVFKYLEEINSLATQDEAEKAFGVTIADLDSQMRSYVNESGRKKVTLKLDGVTDLELPAGTAVSKLDALLGIATVCLDTGLGIDHAHELLDAADREPGGAAHSTPLRMRLAARRKDDAELDRLYGIIGKDTGNARAAGTAGLALYERAQSLDDAGAARRKDLLMRSFDLLDRSLTARPDDPETVWAFAMVAAALDRDLDVALKRLVPMFERLPSNPDMAQAAALVLHSRGDQDVLPYLTAVVRNAHSLEQKRWAAERITAIRAKAAASQAPSSQ